MAQRIAVVDAFADGPFTGNPAAICVLEQAAPGAWMQCVAMEMNLSETAFLYPVDDGYNLRWFTPTVEVDLCGHATLASAHVLFEQGALATGAEARFHTKSGLLTVRQAAGLLEMDMPTSRVEPAEAPPGLLAALGVDMGSVYRTQFDLLVEVASEGQVRGLQPDLAQLRQFDARGVMVTARSDTAGYDFVSRFFAPAAGIDEDPVTGSAHCALAPFWGERLDKDEMMGWQASKRGGAVRVRPRGERALIAGRAVTVLNGELAHRPG